MKIAKLYDAALLLLAAEIRNGGLGHDEVQLQRDVDRAWTLAELLEKREKRCMQENGLDR